MVAHCKVPNRQVQVPTKETYACMAQGQYIYVITPVTLSRFTLIYFELHTDT